MPYIIGVNPRPKKKARPKRKVAKKKAAPKKATKKKVQVKAMAKRRRRRTTKKPTVKYRTRTKTVTRYRSRPKRNPIRRRKSGSTEALQLGKVFRSAGAVSIGMIIAKVAVNKLTEGGSEKVAWTWPNIFMAAGSSVVAAFVLGAFGIKKPTVALIAVGGVGLALFKTFTCKVASKWAWSEEWFGADENYDAIDPAFLGADDIDVYDYEPAAGVGYLPGVGATDAGGQVVPFNPNMGYTQAGGQVVPYNPNMGADMYREIGNRAKRMYNAYAGAY